MAPREISHHRITWHDAISEDSYHLNIRRRTCLDADPQSCLADGFSPLSLVVLATPTGAFAWARSTVFDAGRLLSFAPKEWADGFGWGRSLHAVTVFFSFCLRGPSCPCLGETQNPHFFLLSMRQMSRGFSSISASMEEAGLLQASQPQKHWAGEFWD